MSPHEDATTLDRLVCAGSPILTRLTEEAGFHMWHRRVNGMYRRKFTGLVSASQHRVGTYQVPPRGMGGPTYATAKRLIAAGPITACRRALWKQMQTRRKRRMCVPKRRRRAYVGSEG
jgi:hypothetical protein